MKHTDETKKKIRLANLWEKNPMYWKISPNRWKKYTEKIKAKMRWRWLTVDWMWLTEWREKTWKHWRVFYKLLGKTYK